MTATKILTLVRGLSILFSVPLDKATVLFCAGVSGRHKYALRELGVSVCFDVVDNYDDRAALELVYSASVAKFAKIGDFGKLIESYEKSTSFLMANFFGAEHRRIKDAKLEIYESLGHCLDFNTKRTTNGPRN